jgi:agmatinase
MPRYQPVDALQSPHFCGARTFTRLPFVTTTEEVDVTVVTKERNYDVRHY